MEADRWERVERLFHAACARARGERAVFLEVACADDAELRREVESLLALVPEAQNFIEQPAAQLLGDAATLSAAASAAPDPPPGIVLEGKYRVEALLGSGGMGTVYRATQLNLRRTVALKLIRGAFASDTAARARFAREALALARLKHPNLVTIHDAGLAPGVGAYLVMEYIAGRSLRQQLRERGRLVEREAVGLIRQVCAGVEAAHAHGVLHRDLKPENILLEETASGVLAKVVDFGIAKLAEEAEASGEVVTQAGVLVGTPTYMAPEQCRGEAVDARTDVYALGCVLYELLTGRPPFAAATVAVLLLKQVSEAVPREPLAQTGVSRRVAEAVERALAKQASERYGSARELAAALEVSGADVATAAGKRGASGQRGQETGSPEGATTELGTAPAETRQTATPNNLPQAVTRFIGRAEPLRELGSELAGTRLVTLTGPGGIGKTRLALEVAHDALEEFAGGVWLVELAALTDPMLVPQTVATTLGVREEAGREVTETLVAWLRGRRALLVLDNCEHVVEACARLAEALLRACPQVRVMATSREALGLSGEAVRAVAALEVPARAAGAAEILASEAVRLFVDRAAFVRSDFRFDGGSALTVAALSRRLEGIPLAIELAAARVQVLSVEQILERLEDRFRLLTGGSRTAPSRQQTLRATLDWSYGLLTEQERVLLRRLTVFAGGWSLEAAEGVCTGTGIEAWEILHLLSRLLDKSLLLVSEQARAARYGMLETVREYGREQLGQSGEADEMARRHAEFFLAFGEDVRPKLASVHAVEWYGRLEAEHDNLRAALGWLIEHDPGACLRLAVALSPLWATHGHLAEGRRRLEAALERSRDATAPLRAAALRQAGALAHYQGDLREARAYFDEGLRIAREAGDKYEIAHVCLPLGGLVAIMDGPATAARYLETSLALGRELESVGIVAGSLNCLGEAARQEGDWAAARAYYEQSAAVLRQAGHQLGLNVALGNLGAVACEEGELTVATACFEEALVISQSSKEPDSIALALDGLGAVAAKRGAWERAGRLAGAAQTMRDASGYALEPTDRAFRERYLAEVREQLGEAGLEVALAEGRALTLEQAIGEALAESER
jgi:non-specific serine/threonine protein kinase